MSGAECFRVTSLPDRPFSRAAFLERLVGSQAILFFDMKSCTTVLAVGGDGAEECIKGVCATVPGLEFGRCDAPGLGGVVHMYSLYRRLESIGAGFMSDVFDCGSDDGFIGVAFMADGEESVGRAKGYIESALHHSGFRESTNFVKNEFGRRLSRTVQKEILDGSEESALMAELLEAMNQSLMTNSTAYRVLFFSSAHSKLSHYLKSKFVVLGQQDVKAGCVGDLFRILGSTACIPYGTAFLEGILNFYGSAAIRYIVPTTAPRRSEGILLGTFLKDAVYDTGFEVRAGVQTMNLGFILSGLPGSGKTREAMAVIDQLCRGRSSTGVFIVSPTDEWKSFAMSHGMYYVQIGRDGIPINFFRCPAGADLQSFYQGLAMVLATASQAGPYRNPLEKCLLNAFRRVYSESPAPDPVSAYLEVEESIIRMHGKRTNAGVKYTKHGENIKSALENLVSILDMPEYSERSGICVEELVGSGVVFDLSGVGPAARAYFYAMLLSQAYAVASTFDSDGDDMLRLLICLEEAQMIFGDPRSAAVEDIKQRMQDFRKRGVGLMLLVHNITDIELGIRRLCQLKIYLKQAPDVAPVAAKDLVFTYAQEDSVVSKLKHLDSRIGALSTVERDGNEKTSGDTIFIRTVSYGNGKTGDTGLVYRYALNKGIVKPPVIDCRVSLRRDVDSPMLKSGVKFVRFKYLGEALSEQEVEGGGTGIWVVQRLIKGRKYGIELLDDRRRVLWSEPVEAAESMDVVF